MSYLVKFNSAQGETWEETFETEQQVLDCKNKDSIISIQKIDKELTLEQLQEQMDTQELQEANYKGKHIKVGDIVYFEYGYRNNYDMWNYENFFGKVKSIHKIRRTIKHTIRPIAYEDGTLLQSKDYNPKTCPREVQHAQIFKIFDVCTPEYFDKLIQKEEVAKDEHQAKVVREHEIFCKQQDRAIKKLKVLKGML